MLNKCALAVVGALCVLSAPATGQDMSRIAGQMLHAIPWDSICGHRCGVVLVDPAILDRPPWGTGGGEVVGTVSVSSTPRLGRQTNFALRPFTPGVLRADTIGCKLYAVRYTSDSLRIYAEVFNSFAEGAVWHVIAVGAARRHGTEWAFSYVGAMEP